MFSFFWRTSLLFPNSVLGFPFPHILANISCVLFEGKHNNPKTMKRCKNSSRREVFSNTNLAQEIRNKNLNLMSYLFLIFLLSAHVSSHECSRNEWMDEVGAGGGAIATSSAGLGFGSVQVRKGCTDQWGAIFFESCLDWCRVGHWGIASSEILSSFPLRQLRRVTVTSCDSVTGDEGRATSPHECADIDCFQSQFPSEMLTIYFFWTPVSSSIKCGWYCPSNRAIVKKFVKLGTS